jgi:hypothetical protein
MEALKQSAEPLAQLKDIHLPEQIHNYPIALGWWLLLAMLIITVIFTAIKWQKRRQLYQAQKQALSQLKKTDNSDEIVTLLKWAALHYFPRHEVASLHSQQLQQFLQKKLTGKYQEKFQTLCGQQLSDKYQTTEHLSANSDTNSDLKQAAQLWLNQALPPKKPKPEKTVQQGGMS